MSANRSYLARCLLQQEGASFVVVMSSSFQGIPSTIVARVLDLVEGALKVGLEPEASVGGETARRMELCEIDPRQL